MSEDKESFRIKESFQLNDNDMMLDDIDNFNAL